MANPIDAFVDKILGRSSEAAKPVQPTSPVISKPESPIPPIKVPKTESTSTEIYDDLLTLRNQIKEIDERTRTAGERVRILRERAFCSSMNKTRFWGSPVGSPDGKQREANQRANQRMVKVYESVKNELRLAEAELFKLRKQKEELEEQERSLENKFGAVSTIEALKKEIS
jgi:hypothetical protein